MPSLNPLSQANKNPPRKRKPRQKAKAKAPVIPLRLKLIKLSIEGLSLCLIVGMSMIAVIGAASRLLTAANQNSSPFPFIFILLIFIVLLALSLIAWFKLRQSLSQHTWLTPLMAASIAVLSCLIAYKSSFREVYDDFNIFVGGKQAAALESLQHQVYAQYRRLDQQQLKLLTQRARPYDAAITLAAKEFALDPYLLAGIAATESSFLPRSSGDGGQGLFQITKVPKSLEESTQKRFKLKQLDLNNPKQNSYLAATTFKYYLQEMQGNIFLGLLAYNIGPKNGGLRFIMQQYGVNDFVTIQPYLQQLPRDYPIRVMSYALAFKLWDKYGHFPAYQKEENAMAIQHLGIPGL